MNIVVIDSQGGGIGRQVVSSIKTAFPEQSITAIGTNAQATAAMLKAGADQGATGENPVIVNSADADIIIGPIGIVIANSLLGEITPAMAAAIGSSKAYKILIPVNKCNHFIAGCQETNLSSYISIVCGEVERRLKR